VVYTVPVYVRSPLGLRHDVLNVKVAEPDGAPFGPGMDALREVLARRAPGGDVDRLTGGRTDRMIEQSGGLFRDLLRIPGQLLLNAKRLPADDAAFAQAEATVRNDYKMTLAREHLELLRQIRDSHELIPANDQWPSAFDLITSGAVLTYPNGEQPWFGVHPLLEPLL
jgi:hypothetical protein